MPSADSLERAKAMYRTVRENKREIRERKARIHQTLGELRAFCRAHGIAFEEVSGD